MMKFILLCLGTSDLIMLTLIYYIVFSMLFKNNVELRIHCSIALIK